MIDTDNIILFILIIFGIILGIQFIRGKWLNLIAGYNTMSKKNKATVNTVALSTYLGWLMLLISFSVLLMIVTPYHNIITFLVISVVLSSVVYVNTSSKFKTK